MIFIYAGALYTGFCATALIAIYSAAFLQKRREARAFARAYFVATINIV
jgi:hypothetical protein